MVHLIQYIRNLAGSPAGKPADGILLERFVTARDGASFTALVKRHGPMIWSVCQRVLRNIPDAEDAFQGTFSGPRPKGEVRQETRAARQLALWGGFPDRTKGEEFGGLEACGRGESSCHARDRYDAGPRPCSRPRRRGLPSPG
jgi:hypothetical protein